MKIFVSGASGVIGRPLIERLTANGHEVTSMARSPEGAERLRQLGARPVNIDAFDRDAVWRALEEAEAEVVIDELTSLPRNPAELGRALPADSKLRIEGGGNLFAAAESLGVRRYIQQSSVFYLEANAGLADELASMRINAPGGTGASARMYAELERRVLGSSRMSGTALRYGFFYGPGTWYWNDGAVGEQTRHGEASIVGGGTAVWSFVHVEDAAAATVAAVEAEPGIYNIVDDDPEPVNQWLPAFARWVGGPEPDPISSDDAMALVGAEGVYAHTELTGASNAKARAVLGFEPRPPAWKGA